VPFRSAVGIVFRWGRASEEIKRRTGAVHEMLRHRFLDEITEGKMRS